MISDLVRKYIPDLRVIGVEVCFIGEGKAMYSMVELQRKRGKIEVLRSGVDLALEELYREANKKLPLVLTFTGKGVVTRNWNMSDEGALGTIMPVGNADDFYVNIHDKGENRALVSIMRKQHAEEMLSMFKAEGYRVASFVVGGQQDDDGHARGIPAAVVNAFWGAAQWLAGNLQSPQSPGYQYEKVYEERRMFKAALGFVLGFIFLLLLVNYALFSHYKSKVVQLAQSHSLTGDLSLRAADLENKVLEKERLLEELGMKALSRHSYYADRIASELPEGIRLSALEIFPKQKADEQKEIEFRNGEIEIRGFCEENATLASWISTLKRSVWIKELELVQYNRADWKSDGSFVIKLSV